MSFDEHFRARWKGEPPPEERKKISEIIAWNLWQMDGLTGTIPYSEPMEQISIFDLSATKGNKKETQENRRCIISNWRIKKKNRDIVFANLSMGGRDEMKFDIIMQILIQSPGKIKKCAFAV